MLPKLLIFALLISDLSQKKVWVSSIQFIFKHLGMESICLSYNHTCCCIFFWAWSCAFAISCIIVSFCRSHRSPPLTFSCLVSLHLACSFFACASHGESSNLLFYFLKFCLWPCPFLCWSHPCAHCSTSKFRPQGMGKRMLSIIKVWCGRVKKV